VTVRNTLDTTAPSVAITSPADGSTVGKSVKVKVTASDAAGVVKVELYVDSALYAVSNSASAQFNWNTQSEATGWHTLTAKAYDGAGNVGATSISVLKGDSGTTSTGKGKGGKP